MIRPSIADGSSYTSTTAVAGADASAGAGAVKLWYSTCNNCLAGVAVVLMG